MATYSVILLPSVLFLLLAGHLAYSHDLVPFKKCSSLKSYMVRNAVKRVGAWGLKTPSYCSFYRRDTARRRLRGLASSSTTWEANPVQDVDYSATNVQVPGVDEPDIVKTDGSRVLVVKGRQLYYVKVNADGSDGKFLPNITLPFYPRGMLFDSKSDSVVLISSQWENVPPLKASKSKKLYYPYQRTRPFIVLQRVLIRHPWRLKITDTAYIQGTYVSSRSVGDVGRLVLSYDGSDHIRFYEPGGKLTQQGATKKNIDIMKKSRLSDWLPSYNATGTICRSSGCQKYSYNRILTPCPNTFIPKNSFSGFSLLTVATFRLSGPFKLTGSSIIADGNRVYATEKSLYAATREYQNDVDQFDANVGPSFKTSFHKFELRASSAKYIASGEVTGSVLNQFSMHEYEDTFFVATTDGAPWWTARNTSVSKVSSFRVASDNRLKKVGEVGGLGKGERIYSVRFIGKAAYVVTFRRVDPFYVLDLSNISNLKVTGELKIPGYSAYLHPLGDNRILGVGQDATSTGITTGVKVSLFDVSDVTKPKELSSWSLKGGYTYVEWQYKAFLWWGPENLAVLPVSVHFNNEKNDFIGSIVLQISEKSIKEKGRIVHWCCSSKWNRNIDRTFVIARKNLWSLSNNALQVNDINSLRKKSVLVLYR